VNSTGGGGSGRLISPIFPLPFKEGERRGKEGETEGGKRRREGEREEGEKEASNASTGFGSGVRWQSAGETVPSFVAFLVTGNVAVTFSAPPLPSASTTLERRKRDEKTCWRFRRRRKKFFL
jgi:hypothetical protein